ncbi:hypothetical protein EV137_6912 [Kribbella pratensis]|jgi:hypothetical protein|uniref:LppX_LprAFG lipoprotein n=1 Tax=Kribbella pratensis TaxID=2512112 RepID=A0ABY2F6V3_9ACTN|nr:hypothetical protein [Kribbella pratensis]TDW84108.1 hypothetical protein EV137_6912 [Kribbella pratensis]
MLKRRTAAGAMVGVLVVLVAGCQGSDPATSDNLGTTPTPTPTATSVTPSPVVTPSTPPASTPASTIAGLSSAKILAKTQAAAKAATSVRMKGSMTDDGDRIVLDIRLAKAGGQGTMSINGAAFSLIVLDKTAYLKISDKFWRAQIKKKADADAVIGLVGGRWIKTSLTDQDLGELAAFASKPKFFDTLFEPTGTLRKTAPRTVDGVTAIGLRDTDGTLWVDTVTARPVRLESSGTDALTFSEYNQVATPKAPPAAQVIDGKALGM